MCKEYKNGKIFDRQFFWPQESISFTVRSYPQKFALFSGKSKIIQTLRPVSTLFLCSRCGEFFVWKLPKNAKKENHEISRYVFSKRVTRFWFQEIAKTNKNPSICRKPSLVTPWFCNNSIYQLILIQESRDLARKNSRIFMTEAVAITIEHRAKVNYCRVLCYAISHWSFNSM